MRPQRYIKFIMPPLPFCRVVLADWRIAGSPDALPVVLKLCESQ